ncbi:MAG: ABC transporter substrate-binding protein [Chloroflexi bacterium]|nr:ABC transporter substrate-binding protein [Chloroflexota bacterium]
MRMSKVFIAIGLVALILAGCSKSPAATTAATTTKPAQTTTMPPATRTTAATTAAATQAPTATAQSGKLTIGVGSFGDENRDPIAAGGTAIYVLHAPVFDYMFYANGSALGPGIVEKWTIAPDGLSWTFNIRKGVKFHNGDNLTAEDVKFSLERYMTDSTSMYTLVKDMVQSVTKVDDFTLSIKTKGTQPDLGWMLSDFPGQQGLVMPKAYFESKGLQNFKDNPVGSGSWKFVKHTRGDSAEFVATEQQWRQTPTFKQLQVLSIPEEMTRVAMLKTGALDAIDVGFDNAGSLSQAGFTIASLNSSTPSVMLLGINDARAKGMPTANPKVREALSLAVNREEVRKVFFHGLADPAVPAGINPNSPDIDLNYWRTFANDYLKYDPARSKQLLSEAGYANGFNVKFWTFTVGGQPYLPKLGELLQGYWKAVNINVEIVPSDLGAYRAQAIGGANSSPTDQMVGQISLMAHSATPSVGRGMYTPWYSGNRGGVGGSKVDKQYPGMDELIDKIYAEIDPAKRRDLITQAVKLGAETRALQPVAFVPDTVAISPKILLNLTKPSTAGLVTYAAFAKRK